MRIRWTTTAGRDLHSIARYIEQDDPRAAVRVITIIYAGCDGLARFPRMGRKGKKEGTRELVFVPLPYIAIYRIRDEVIEILRIWHGAQDR